MIRATSEGPIGANEPPIALSASIQTADLAAIVGLVFFLAWFCLPMALGRARFTHPDIFGYYFPFREWFTEQLQAGHFPLWTDMRGFGQVAESWLTVPIDLLTPVEMLLGFSIPLLYTVQWTLVGLLAFFGFRYLTSDISAGAIATVTYLIGPWTNYFLYYYVHAFWFGFHIIGVVALLRYVDRGKRSDLGLFAGSCALGMLGTKLELSLIEALFFAAATPLFVMTKAIGPDALPMRHVAARVMSVAVALLLAIAINAWQIEIITSAVAVSSRAAAPDFRGLLHSLQAALAARPEPLFLVGFGFLSARGILPKAARWSGALFLIGVGSLISGGSQLFLEILMKPEGLGLALGVAILVARAVLQNRRPSAPIDVGAVVLTGAMLVFYWGRPGRGDLGELEQIGDQLPVIRFFVAALCLLGSARGLSDRAVRMAIVSLIVVFLMRDLGNVFLSRLLGFVWLPTRDSYIVEAALAALVAVAASDIAALFKATRRFSELASASLAVTLTIWPALLLGDNPYKSHPLMEIVPRSPSGRDPYEELRRHNEAILARLTALSYGTPRLLDFDAKFNAARPYNDLYGFGLLFGVQQVHEYQSTASRAYVDWSTRLRFRNAPRTLAVMTAEMTPASQDLLPPLAAAPRDMPPQNYYFYYELNAVPPISCSALAFLGVDFVAIPNSNVSSLYYRGDEREIEQVTSCPGAFVSFPQQLQTDNRFWHLTSVLPTAFLIRDGVHAASEAITAVTGYAKNGLITIDKPDVSWSWRPAEVQRSGDQVRVRISSKKSGQLVLTDLFAPHWRAMIDGKDAPISRAFSLFRAVAIGPGEHEVVFTYDRTPFYMAVGLAALAGLAGIAWSVLTLFIGRLKDGKVNAH